MTREVFLLVLQNDGARAVLKAIEAAYTSNVDKAEEAVGRLLDMGLKVEQLPLAFALCCRSAEWFTSDAETDPAGLIEKVLEIQEGVERR